MIEVVLQQIGQCYPGGIEALSAIDARIEPGELFVVMGASGSGKSTLLRLIAGLELPSSGRIYLDGVDAGPIPPHRRQLALLPQRIVLHPHLDVGGNLRFGLPRRGWWSGQLHDPLERQLKELSQQLRIDHLLERKPSTLSGGEQQRVALARILLRRPRLLLLDEPFAALDGPLRWELRQELHLLLAQLGTTMVLVTHEQDEAISLADRILVINQGRAVQIGSPEQILHRPVNTLVARMAGWPPINLLPGTLLSQDGKVRLDGGLLLPVPSTWVDLPSQPVVLGIRPDQVRVCPADTPSPSELVLGMTLATPSPDPASGYVRVQWGQGVLTGRVENQPHNDSVWVALDFHRAILFAATSGQALRHGSPRRRP